METKCLSYTYHAKEDKFSVRAKINWASEKMKSRVLEALSHFVEIEKVQFERKAIFSEAKKLTFKFYFDGSLQGIGVSVVCSNELPDGQKVYRLLCNKAKILGNDVNTAPRSELCAFLVNTRLYILIMKQLKQFLSVFKGEVEFQILGDSTVVLNQIKQHSYHFATFSACRVQEIRENTKDFDISWLHVSSHENISDILTRPYYCPPQDLPWVSYTMNINEEKLHTTEIPVPCLPDSDKKNILALAQVTNPLETGSLKRQDMPDISTQQTLPDLPTVMLYTELRRKLCIGQKKHNPNKVSQRTLQRNSNDFKCRNIFMRILQWHPKHRGKSLDEIKKISENKIFQEFQSEASVYVQNFRGSMFYTFQEDGILMLKARNTIYGETRFKLVPTKTLLYDRLTQTYHQKYHKIAAYPVYIRSHMLVV